MKLIKTADLSYTLFSTTYNEHYHSLKSGAFSEALFKHVKPCVDFVLSKDPDSISILDICFGLGYNTLATLYYLDEKKYMGDVEIFSPELDEELIRDLKFFPYPKELIFYSDVVLAISKNLSFNYGGFNITVLINDAKEIVKNTNKKFDIIYQDAFSVKKNPQLWEVEFFKNLYRLSKENAILTTYSQAKGVRKILKDVGFSIFEHNFDKKSSIRPGTIALKNHTLESALCLQV
jgi:tRNA U34 5-methylaminomethyl-2-thiouridine-forming methyltransferase MnmC